MKRMIQSNLRWILECKDFPAGGDGAEKLGRMTMMTMIAMSDDDIQDLASSETHYVGHKLPEDIYVHLTPSRRLDR